MHESVKLVHLLEKSLNSQNILCKKFKDYTNKTNTSTVLWDFMLSTEHLQN